MNTISALSKSEIKCEAHRVKVTHKLCTKVMADAYAVRIAGTVATVVQESSVLQGSEAGRLFIANQLKNTLKKYIFSPEDARILHETAVAGFIRGNERLALVNARLNTAFSHLDTFNSMENFFVLSTDPDTLSDVKFKRIMCDARMYFSGALGALDMDRVFRSCQHGGGVTQGVSHEVSHLEIAKFRYPITSTARQKDIFELYLHTDPSLKAAIIASNGGCDLVYRIVVAVKLQTVEKDDEKNRTIGIETTVGMFLQQGVKAELVLILSTQCHINISKAQDIHRVEAFISSICGRKVTVDLTNASDNVATILVDFLSSYNLPWLKLLRALRAENFVSDGKIYHCEMFSSMGNAFTFPLQTLVFWAISTACINYNASQYLVEEKHKVGFARAYFWNEKERARFSSLHEFGVIESREGIKAMVYGDDILLPPDAFTSFEAISLEVGFILNRKKTATLPPERKFWNGELVAVNAKDPFRTLPIGYELPFKAVTSLGCFRESCGGDFYAGCYVGTLDIRAPSLFTDNGITAWLNGLVNNLLVTFRGVFGSRDYIYIIAPVLEIVSEAYEAFGSRIYPIPDDYPPDAGISALDPRVFAMFPPRLIAPIRVDRNGTMSYSFLRFRYSGTTVESDDLVYARWLRMNAYDIPQNQGYTNGEKSSFEYQFFLEFGRMKKPVYSPSMLAAFCLSYHKYLCANSVRLFTSNCTLTKGTSKLKRRKASEYDVFLAKHSLSLEYGKKKVGGSYDCCNTTGPAFM